MPLSTFSDGLRNVLSFLPGTYGTSLLRNHALRGVFAEMEGAGVPEPFLDGIRDMLDCNLYVFDSVVPLGRMYAILGISVAVFIGIFLFLCTRKKKLK